MPYQDYTTSKILAVNAYYNFESSETNGGLKNLPYSHKLSIIPSDEYIKIW